jgi:hypothetical protein
MNDVAKPPLLRRRRITPFRGRGPIYNWLRAHHRAIKEMMEAGRTTWPRLCEEMVRHGVIARGGLEPSTRAASKAWQTVCRDLEELGEAEAAKPYVARSKPPSRLPKDWRPQEITPAAALPALAGPTPGAKAPYDPDKAMGHLKRIMNELSGRRGQAADRLAISNTTPSRPDNK